MFFKSVVLSIVLFLPACIVDTSPISGPPGADGDAGPPGPVDPEQFIQNTTASQDASFNISGPARVDTDLFLGGQSVYSLLPFYRLTSNQTLKSVGGAGIDIPTGWEPNGKVECGVSVEFAQNVSGNALWSDRSPEEKALLTAMGRPQAQYLFGDFNIYRIKWTGENCWLLGQRAPTQPQLTVAAFTKVEAGSISSTAGFWANGATNTWSLTGDHIQPNLEGYIDAHPYTATKSGSLLVALPAVVAGWVDLSNPTNWAWFPYVNPYPNPREAECPDPLAVSNYGFCIWLISGDTKTYTGAAAACRSQGARLCTRAELSAAHAAGAEWCNSGWLADRETNSTAWWGYPMQQPMAGCGNTIGIVEQVDMMTLPRGATCCRP